MKELTDIQKEVLRFIVICQADGFTPSMQAISDRFEWASANSAQEHVNRLIKKAFILKPSYKRLVVTEYALRYLQDTN